MLNSMNAFSNKQKQSNAITLYHGSCDKVQKPLFGVGKSDNDYGSGFYTTRDFDKAASWAVSMGRHNAAFVNEYTLALDDLSVLNLRDYGVLAWIAEISANRAIRAELAADFLPEFIAKYKPDTSNADVIVGYRADDSYTDVVSAFVDGLLNCDEVKRLFYKGELGEQYFVKSERAFDALRFVKCTDVRDSVVAGQLEAESLARQEVFNFLNQRRLAVAKRYYVSPVTIIDAIESDYHYVKEYDYYVKAGGN